MKKTQIYLLVICILSFIGCQRPNLEETHKGLSIAIMNINRLNQSSYHEIEEKQTFAPKKVSPYRKSIDSLRNKKEKIFQMCINEKIRSTKKSGFHITIIFPMPINTFICGGIQ